MALTLSPVVILKSWDKLCKNGFRICQHKLIVVSVYDIIKLLGSVEFVACQPFVIGSWFDIILIYVS